MVLKEHFKIYFLLFLQGRRVYIDNFSPGPEVIKKNMLNSAGHEFIPVHKC